MSKLERKWWFVSIVSVLTMTSTIGVLYAAGLPPFRYSAAQWVVWFFCYVGLHRCFSFLGWMTVLIVSPKTITLERT